MHTPSYTTADRVLLASLTLAGMVVNVAFVFASLARPEALAEAWTNPVAAAFMVEAVVVLVALCHMLHTWGMSRLHWGWFVVLSLLGSIAFALPVVLLFGQASSRGAPARLADPT